MDIHEAVEVFGKYLDEKASYGELVLIGYKDQDIIDLIGRIKKLCIYEVCG